jgi:hypothetical protein
MDYEHQNHRQQALPCVYVTIYSNQVAIMVIAPYLESLLHILIARHYGWLIHQRGLTYEVPCWRQFGPIKPLISPSSSTNPYGGRGIWQFSFYNKNIANSEREFGNGKAKKKTEKKGILDLSHPSAAKKFGEVTARKCHPIQQRKVRG